MGLLLFDSVPCFAIPAIRCTRDNWIFLDDMIATSDELLTIRLGLVDLSVILT